MQLRLELLRYEVEVVRGRKWEEGGSAAGAERGSGSAQVARAVSERTQTGTDTRTGSGLSDEEVRRRMEQRLAENGDAGEEGGVYL